MFRQEKGRQAEIARRLKYEAENDRPEFSPGLHERIMSAVAQCNRVEKQPRRFNPSSSLWLALAAGLVIAATLPWVWPSGETPLVDRSTPASVSPENRLPESPIAPDNTVANNTASENTVVDETITMATVGDDLERKPK